jgi:hypothetical protein
VSTTTSWRVFGMPHIRLDVAKGCRVELLDEELVGRSASQGFGPDRPFVSQCCSVGI